MLKTLDNALIILDKFNEKHSWGVRELAREVGINYTTIYKTLNTFKKHGLVIQDEGSEKYELGYKILEYYSTLKERIQFIDELSTIMNHISETTKETIFLNVMEENYAVCVKIAESRQSYLRLVIKVGNRLPLHVGARGKAMLANLPKNKQEEIIKTNMKEEDEAAKEKLRDELEEIKNQGWCLTVGERFASVVGISIPLFNKRNEVVASLTIGIPHNDIKDEEVLEYVETLRKNQHTIESLLSIEN